jgi:hypothetical protein
VAGRLEPGLSGNIEAFAAGRALVVSVVDGSTRAGFPSGAGIRAMSSRGSEVGEAKVVTEDYRVAGR